MGSLLLFHAYNAKEARFIGHLYLPKLSKLKVLWLGKSGEIAFPARRQAGAQDVDGATRALIDWGYLVHYRAGRRPPMLLTDSRGATLRLYTRDEVPSQFASEAAGPSPGFASALAATVQRFQEHGVYFVLLPVPTKISIERDHLPSVLPPESPWSQERWPTLRRKSGENHPAPLWERTAPGNVVNLTGIYQKEYGKGRHDLYLPLGTHWTSRGIALAAREVIASLARQGYPVRAAEVELQQTLNSQFQYDLLNLFGLPLSFIVTRPEFKWAEPIYGLKGPHSGGAGGRIYVAGSCYSGRFRESYGLGPTLAQYTGRLLVDYSVDFSPAILPLRNLAEEIAFERDDVLVWEFPLRTPPGPQEDLPHFHFAGEEEEF